MWHFDRVISSNFTTSVGQSSQTILFLSLQKGICQVRLLRKKKSNVLCSFQTELK